MFSDQRYQLFVRLAANRGRLEMSEPNAVAGFLKRADTRPRFDLHLNDFQGTPKLPAIS